MTGSVLGTATNAASMKIDAGIAIATRGCAGEGKAELLAIGGEQGILAMGAGGNGGGWSSSGGSFCLTIGWEMTWGSTTKTAGTGTLVSRLGSYFNGDLVLCWRGGWGGLMVDWSMGCNYCECHNVDGAQVVGGV